MHLYLITLTPRKLKQPISHRVLSIGLEQPAANSVSAIAKRKMDTLSFFRKEEPVGTTSATDTLKAILKPFNDLKVLQVEDLSSTFHKQGPNKKNLQKKK